MIRDIDQALLRITFEGVIYIQGSFSYPIQIIIATYIKKTKLNDTQGSNNVSIHFSPPGRDPERRHED